VDLSGVEATYHKNPGPNPQKASLKPSAFRFWHVLEKITDAMEILGRNSGAYLLISGGR